MKSNERYKTDIEAMINPLVEPHEFRQRLSHEIMHKIRTIDDLISETASTGALPTGLQNMITTKIKDPNLDEWENKFGHQNQIYVITSFQRTSLVCWKTENQRSTEYIPKLLNIKISNKSPNKYFSEIEKINANLGSQILDELIPNWIFNESTSDRYQEFLSERASKMMKLVDKYTF